MPDPPPSLSSEDRRWLHDKLERLAAEENQLAAGRTTYYAAIGTVLITALIVAVADLLSQPRILVVIVTFLSALGILISFVWTGLLRRTNDAKNLWSEAAARLEREQPPIEGEWMVPVTLRTDASLPLNLLRPFAAHQARFSSSRRVAWTDRMNPDTLTEVLPFTFLALWTGVLVGAWIWFLLVYF
ncbi:MAG: hypothetical protein L3K23_09290 [Thermoplasmata archaeon]|nr:hypothetical protein [Thermoplasmata archaeon]